MTKLQSSFRHSLAYARSDNETARMTRLQIGRYADTRRGGRGKTVAPEIEGDIITAGWVIGHYEYVGGSLEKG